MKILAVGRNYLKHIQEMGGDKPSQDPVIFTKPQTSINREKVFKLPEHNRPIHHEIELGIVIGKQGKNISQEEAYNYVSHYFVALDLTDRDLQTQLRKLGQPWDIAKGQDGFLPISEFVPAAQVKDPNNLILELTINGKIIQKDTTAAMYFKIPYIIQYISQFMTLNEGDMIITGTPEGVGPLSKGDKVVALLIQDEPICKIELDII